MMTLRSEYLKVREILEAELDCEFNRRIHDDEHIEQIFSMYRKQGATITKDGRMLSGYGAHWKLDVLDYTSLGIGEFTLTSEELDDLYQSAMCIRML